MTKIEAILGKCRVDEGPASTDLSRTVSSVSRTRCQILSLAIRRVAFGVPAPNEAARSYGAVVPSELLHGGIPGNGGRCART